MAWFNHTPETDAVIREGYAANRKISLIAADLGVSKNVVIGRAFRLDLCDPDRLAAAIAASARSPEGRAVRSARAKDRWNNPEWRKRTVASMRIAGMWRRHEGSAA